MKYLPVIILVFLIFLFAVRCEHGLSPPNKKNTNPNNLTGISGVIIYKNYQNWPSPDSLFDLRLVAFPHFPPQNPYYEIFTKIAKVYPPIDTSAHLQFNVLYEEYVMELPPDTFEYILVAQQYEDSLTSWLSVGQYDTYSDSLPTPVIVIQDSLLENININVDFKNLPIQPF